MDILLIIGFGGAVAGIGWFYAKWQGAKKDNEFAQQQLQAEREQHADTQGKLNECEQQLSGLGDTVKEAEIQINRLQVQKEQLEHNFSNLLNYKKEMNEQFESIANKILQEKDQILIENNKQNLQPLLVPLEKNLDTFRQDLGQINTQNIKERETLKAHINQLQSNISGLHDEANKLSNALRGSKKQQGNWGELMLERVLEKSGLKKGLNYELQVALQTEDNKRQLPDCIIYLPEDRQLIIDAKVSLNDYNDYINADDDSSSKTSLDKHLNAVRNHIITLSKKNYSGIESVRSPDFVFIFLPIESAFHLALQADNDLLQFAADKNIVIASPTTLLAMLKMVNYLWKIENQQKNAEEIALRGGRLYDKFCGFLNDMGAISKSIDTLRNNYDNAYNKLTTGRGNLISQAETMQRLGVKHSKNLPDNFKADLED